MWGGEVLLKGIEDAMDELRKQRQIMVGTIQTTIDGMERVDDTAVNATGGCAGVSGGGYYK